MDRSQAATQAFEWNRASASAISFSGRLERLDSIG